MRYRHIYPTPIGELTLFADDGQLTGLYFEDHSPEPKRVATFEDAAPFQRVMDQLDGYFAGDREQFEVPLLLSGTDFQRRVWQALQTIRHGETRTYAMIADACGSPNAFRAVGAATARNPISIIVPCHRVISSSGALTGFAGGIERKRWLLDLEAMAIAR